MRVDVYSDIACPWCFVGERRLKRALEAHPDVKLEWHWRAFQLQPGLPARGLPWESFSAQKFGGSANRDAAFSHVAQAGALEGIVFDFQRMPVAPNTVNAHRVVKLAETQGLGQRAAEVLFKAYFSDALDITDPEVLETLGVQIGLGENAVRAMLETGQFEREVIEDGRAAQAHGITGVPFFVFNQKYALSGAQPIEVFERAIQMVKKEFETIDRPGQSSPSEASGTQRGIPEG
jgi:predicted DsbA family dithiol-disulfide isomerase